MPGTPITFVDPVFTDVSADAGVPGQTWTDAVLLAPIATEPPNPTDVLALVQGGFTKEIDFASLAAAINPIAVVSPALSVLGRSPNSSGTVAPIAGVDNQVLRVSGGVLGFGAVDLSTSQVTGGLPPANGGTGATTLFTPGSVVFAGTAGAYSQNNPNLFWNNAGNRLGIGTSSPASWLHITTPGAVNVSSEATTGEMANCWQGSAAMPVTAIDPTVLISRYEALNLIDTQGGQNAGLAVYCTGNNTSPVTGTAQVNGITAKAFQIGSGDVCGGYFVAEQHSVSGQHTAYGVFALGVAGTGTLNAIGVNPLAANNTGNPYTYAGLLAGAAYCVGDYIQGIGTQRSSAGVFISGTNASVNFDVGIGFNYLSTNTADIQSNSSAIASYVDRGHHSYSIDLSGATISAADIRLHSGDTIANNSAGVVGITGEIFTGGLFAGGDVTAGNYLALNTASTARRVLHVSGNVMAADDVTRLQSAGGGISIENNASTTLVAIQNGGNVGIGTTSPSQLLDVNGIVAVKGAAFLDSDATFTSLNDRAGRLAIALGGTASNTNYYRNSNHSFQSQGGAATWAIFDATNTRNIIGNWSTISARELKQEISPYERGLAAVRMLSPMVFRYRPGTPFAKSEDEPSELLLGLIADEVEPVMPELVGETSATIGKEEIAVATLTPGNAIYAMINSIKELATRLEAVEAKL